MSIEACRVVTLEIVRPHVPGAAATAERVLVPGIFKLKLTLLDEEHLLPSVDREFLCVDGYREQQIVDEMKAKSVVWI